MFIIGLTGGLATGKSTVLSIFKDNGIAVVDADQIARQVIEPNTKGWHQLKETFGSHIIQRDGTINRTILGEIVFDNADKRRQLNKITHPKIQWEMIRIAFFHFLKGRPYVVMELPLLFESGRMINFIYKIITVVCEDDQQLERLCKRNDFTEQMAMKRITAQMSLDYKMANSNFVIDNSGSIEDTRKQTEAIIKYLNQSYFHWYIRALIAVPAVTTVGIVTYLLYTYS